MHSSPNAPNAFLTVLYPIRKLEQSRILTEISIVSDATKENDSTMTGLDEPNKLKSGHDFLHSRASLS